MFYHNGTKCQKVNNLLELNDVLSKLDPPITDVSTDKFDELARIPNFLDTAIKESTYTIINGIEIEEMIEALNKCLRNHGANTDFANYEYDYHGNNHFGGGPHSGTKFIESENVCNPIIVNIIKKYKDKIRSMALNNKDSVVLYIQEEGDKTICPQNNSDITIQVSYIIDTDSVEYHAYPDNCQNYGISYTKSA